MSCGCTHCRLQQDSNGTLPLACVYFHSQKWLHRQPRPCWRQGWRGRVCSVFCRHRIKKNLSGSLAGDTRGWSSAPAVQFPKLPDGTNYRSFRVYLVPYKGARTYPFSWKWSCCDSARRAMMGFAWGTVPGTGTVHVPGLRYQYLVRTDRTGIVTWYCNFKISPLRMLAICVSFENKPTIFLLIRSETLYGWLPSVYSRKLLRRTKYDICLTMILYCLPISAGCKSLFRNHYHHHQ